MKDADAVKAGNALLSLAEVLGVDAEELLSCLEENGFVSKDDGGEIYYYMHDA